MDPRVAALLHGPIPQETFVAVIVNVPQRQILPRVRRAELLTVYLQIPVEMEPELWRVFREGARDARVAYS